MSSWCSPALSILCSMGGLLSLGGLSFFVVGAGNEDVGISLLFTAGALFVVSFGVFIYAHTRSERRGGDRPVDEHPNAGDRPVDNAGDRPVGEHPNAGDRPVGEHPNVGDQPVDNAGDRPVDEHPNAGDRPVDNAGDRPVVRFIYQEPNQDAL